MKEKFVISSGFVNGGRKPIVILQSLKDSILRVESIISTSYKYWEWKKISDNYWSNGWKTLKIDSCIEE